MVTEKVGTFTGLASTETTETGFDPEVVASKAAVGSLMRPWIHPFARQPNRTFNPNLTSLGKVSRIEHFPSPA
jgi:hypothetical protein